MDKFQKLAESVGILEIHLNEISWAKNPIEAYTALRRLGVIIQNVREIYEKNLEAIELPENDKDRENIKRIIKILDELSQLFEAIIYSITSDEEYKKEAKKSLNTINKHITALKGFRIEKSG